MKRVSEAEKAKAFLEFQYPEVKDLTKQFLTVVAGVLALSVTFSEKIVIFGTASLWVRGFMFATWGLCLLAFVLGGCAIYLIYNAGVAAKYTALHNRLWPYQWRTWLAYQFLNVAGCAFVLALCLMVATGISKLF
ncbi:MAG TPA: hypothetical protein VJL90_14715 [Pseudorhodoplanes sp.]|nr:hypothetical protein [Pseudorhodoplanes sp.]